MSKISSGISGLDALVDSLYVGDNVVWEVDTGTSYELFIKSFIEKSVEDAEKIIYISFNKSPQSILNEINSFINPAHFVLVDCFTAGKGKNDVGFLKFYSQTSVITCIKIDNPRNIDQFTNTLNSLEDSLPPGARYVFDSLTGMQDLWGDENDTYKFFTYMCPRLFDLETIAYWILEKDAHSQKFKANLRHITQVVFDLYKRKERLYIKALKLTRRPDREAFRPHRYEIVNSHIIFSQLKKDSVADIGHWIKEARMRLGISQKEIADKVDLTPSFISQLESNQISPSLNSFVQICSALSINPGHLFEDERIHAAPAWLIRREALQTNLLSNEHGVMIYSVCSDERFLVRLVILEPNTRVEKHFFHHKAEAFIYVLKGKLSVTAGGGEERLRSGDALCLKEFFPTRWETEDDEAELLVVWSEA